MSITLKTNQIKLKIQNGNYQAPVVIADQTTSEHVAEVNTAITTTGNQQVSAIQTKGDEVLNSIPEDYTDLVEEVDELKSAIENSIGTTDTPIPTTETLDCIIKSRWNGSATPSSANGRARSPRIEYVSGMLSITLKSNDVLFMSIWGSDDGETLTLWNDVGGGTVRDISTFPYQYLYFDFKRKDNQAFADDFPTNIIEITSEGSSTEKQLNIVKDLITGHGSYRVIAGCIRRQSQSDNWDFIADQNHQCDLNCTSVSVNDRGNIVINYPDLNTKKVIFASAFPDETFTSLGISCGSSVGKELTNIYVYKTIPLSGIAEVAMLGITATLITSQGHILSANWDSASSVLDINHDIPGSFHALSINITQTGTGEIAIPRVVRNVSGTIGIQFYDISGNLITNFANTTQFTISIVNTREMERVYTSGNDLYSAEGNFWFFGIFEVF